MPDPRELGANRKPEKVPRSNCVPRSSTRDAEPYGIAEKKPARDPSEPPVTGKFDIVVSVARLAVQPAGPGRGTGDALGVREGVGVDETLLLGVGVFVGVGEREGVTLGVGVPEGVLEGVTLEEGVLEGEGSAEGATNGRVPPIEISVTCGMDALLGMVQAPVQELWTEKPTCVQLYAFRGVSVRVRAWSAHAHLVEVLYSCTANTSAYDVEAFRRGHTVVDANVHTLVYTAGDVTSEGMRSG